MSTSEIAELYDNSNDMFLRMLKLEESFDRFKASVLTSLNGINWKLETLTTRITTVEAKITRLETPGGP